MINKKQLEKANSFQKTVADILEVIVKDPTLSKVKVNIDELKAGLADPKKTLEKMEVYIKAEAKKGAKGGCAIKTDEWVSQQACNYYTSKEKPKPAPKPVATPKPKPKPAPKPKVKVVEKELSLFDL